MRFLGAIVRPLRPGWEAGLEADRFGSCSVGAMNVFPPVPRPPVIGVVVCVSRGQAGFAS